MRFKGLTLGLVVGLVAAAVVVVRVPRAGADYGTFPFRSCWSEAYADSPNSGAVDIRSFSLQYDCTQQEFLLVLSATRPIDRDLSLIKELAVDLDTDGNRSDGCNGADYRIFLRTSNTAFINYIYRTPSCAGDSWENVDFAGGTAIGNTQGLLFETDNIGSPATFRWWGWLTQWSDPNQTDHFPDVGAETASCFATPARTSVTGYWIADAGGASHGFGDAASCSGTAPAPLAAPAVGLAPTRDHRGTWIVASDGGIVTYGDARFFGSTGALRLNRPIVGMAATPSGRGYWLVASDGGIFSFGDARFFGSTGALRLNRPIVGMAATPSGRGYWLVASDGGIFSFGDARFFGSTGALRLNRPIVGMAATPSGRGYWLVASDGGIFSFGDARYFGSTGAIRLVSPVVGMAATPSGRGYRFVAADGGVFAYGDASFHGSLAGAGSARVVGIAS